MRELKIEKAENNLSHEQKGLQAPFSKSMDLLISSTLNNNNNNDNNNNNNNYNNNKARMVTHIPKGKK